MPVQTLPATAAGVNADVALNVLVLDDGSPSTAAIKERLTAEGQNYTTIDLTSSARQEITEEFLVTLDGRGAHGKFSGIVAPNEAPGQLSAQEQGLLDAYAAGFKVRTVVAYTWAHPGVGLNYAAKPGYTGSIDGMTASVTPAGSADAFSYLRGVSFDDISPDVPESYGYLATPATATADSSFTPLLTAPIPGTQEQGSLIGVHSRKGREQLILTFSSNKYQNHWRALSHGIVRWVTRGISTTFNRNYFSVHIDDIFESDDLWSEEGNCTIGDGCDTTAYPPEAPGSKSRMSAKDADRVVSWQKSNGIKLDMVYNGNGALQHRADVGSDELEDALLAQKRELRWVNHTWSHPYLGCIQDESVSPWQCVQGANGGIKYADAVTIRNEIVMNSWYAFRKKLPGYDYGVLVTGEHSGLKSLPQMEVDNPNLARVLDRNRIDWIASDASRESGIRKIGRATTVPRYPMNIYYNNETKAQAVDEYNWVYTSAADGGSGLCERYPDVMTCIQPLEKPSGFDSYIVPIEARIALGHMLGNDPRPHYAHQSNLAADGILYPVAERVLKHYRESFADNAPVINPTMREAGVQLERQARWANDQSKVVGKVSGTTVTLRNTSRSGVTVPVTMPAGTRQARKAFGESYGGESSSWVYFRRGQQRTYRLAAESGFANSVVWPPTVPGQVPEPLPQNVMAPPAVVEPKNEADIAVLKAADGLA
ncbi:MAG: hypothetical protein Q3997_02905 [Propionibacteriaceae bacterium]|nr:hypothetical protein [Propionibacteriaceae bacterium]